MTVISADFGILFLVSPLKFSKSIEERNVQHKIMRKIISYKVVVEYAMHGSRYFIKGWGQRPGPTEKVLIFFIVINLFYFFILKSLTACRGVHTSIPMET